MNNLFNKYGFTLSNEQINKFETLYLDIVEKNKVLNLTSITERNEFYIKHFLDSILPLQNIYGNVLDVGTGAGFPGIPLKIMNSELNIVLLDSLKKRLLFLDEEINKLCLNNISTIHARCEDYGQGAKRETYDFVVSRAVAKLNTLCEYCLPLVKLGGYFIAYKSQDAQEELNQAINCIKKLGGVVEKTEEYNIEGNERTLIYIKKVGNTPKQYPRGQNKPRLKPLQ